MKSADISFEYGSKSEEIKRSDSAMPRFRAVAGKVIFIVLSMITAAVMLISLLARVELIRLNGENVALRQELSELNEINKRLCIQYEYAQDLQKLEERAKNELGMQSIAQIHKETIDPEVVDKAQIINNG